MRSPGAPRLILVPTPVERERLERLGGFGRGAGLVETGGFGPVAAAARTAELITRLAPRSVLLVGIAGTYDPDALPVGEAELFGAVAVDGIGAGEGDGFRSAGALGFPHANDLGDRLELASDGPLVVTVCAAAASEAQAARRRERHPGALAEDMESFGVALACALQGVPLDVVRGISNRVGDRDPAGWEIDAALKSAHVAAIGVLARGPR